MRVNPHDYNITIRRAEIEGEICFEARIMELPDLTEYADSYEEAYSLAIDAIETTIEVMNEKGRSIPVPYIPADDYSGRVTLRLPKSLHRALAGAAEQEDVSLNQHLINILSYYSGFAARIADESRQWRPGLDKVSRSSDKKPNLRIVTCDRPELPIAEGWS